MTNAARRPGNGVVLVSPYPNQGGPTVAGSGGSALNWYTRAYAAALRGRSWDVTVVGQRGRDAVWDDRGVRVVSAYDRGSLCVARQIGDAILREPRAVVHVQHELFAYGGIASAFALPSALRRVRGRGRPVVTTVHGVIQLERIDRAFVRGNGILAPPSLVRQAWHALLVQVARASDVLHVHEAEHATWLRSSYGVTAPIVVAPIGAEPEAGTPARSAARERLGLPREARVVLFFGYLLERKGIIPFLGSVRAMLAADPSLVVIVAGSVPDRVAGTLDIARTLEQLAAHPRFRAEGFVPDERVAELFASSDVLVLPYTFSMSASGPFALALAHERPVLLSEVFRTSYPDAPLLFAPTEAGIATAVARFFADPPSRVAAERFIATLRAGRSWSAIAERMSALYDGLRS